MKSIRKEIKKLENNEESSENEDFQNKEKETSEDKEMKESTKQNELLSENEFIESSQHIGISHLQGKDVFKNAEETIKNDIVSFKSWIEKKNIKIHKRVI